MMTKKRKTKQFSLADAEALLKKIEKETKATIKGNLTDNWRDNLFDILMTRMEITNKYRNNYIKITGLLKNDPQKACKFTKNLFNTLHNILFMAKAPENLIYITALSTIYIGIINIFLEDDTKDLSKTMAGIDRYLGYFENFVNFIPCKNYK